MKRIIILKQGLSGGTDRILDDFYLWLKSNFDVEIFVGNELIISEGFNGYIILPTSEMHTLWKYRKKLKESKILIWSMGHDAVQASFFNSSIVNVVYKYFFFLLYKLFLKAIIPLNNIVYTDLIGKNNDLKTLGYRLVEESSEGILPIPINIDFENSFRYKESRSYFWLGRVDDDFKVWPLIELLNNLESLGNETEFNIIGSGNAINKILADDYSFKVNKLGFMEYGEMEDILNKNAGLVFAMGTSALEGAKMGIPTILVSPLRKGETGGSYRYTFHSKGFSLGEFKGVAVYPVQPNFTLEYLLNNYHKNSNTVSEKSYCYSKNFSRDYIYKKLLSYIEMDIKENGVCWSFIFPYVAYKLRVLIKNIFKPLLRG
ncbi:TPA: hypothetical protein ACX6SS_002894 [Photobacterium damselae]